MPEHTKMASRSVSLQRMKRLLPAGLAVVVGLTAIHRLYFQFRPVPVWVGFTRAMKPAEKNTWVARIGNSPPSEQVEWWDSRPYPDPKGEVKLASTDLFVIRAKASWASLMPWRSTGIEARRSSEVILHVFERHHTQLHFTKDASGWRMKPFQPTCILRNSENEKPVFSFQ